MGKAHTFVATFVAWDLIGYDGTPTSVYGLENVLPPSGSVRVRGGRTEYESVGNNGGERVRLSRLDTTDGLHAVVRYVDADTLLEVVER